MSGNFLGNCLCTLLGAGVFIAGCTILLVTAFPVVQIALGAAYMYECPAAPGVPVYVMVSGIMVLLIMSLLAVPKLLCPAAPGHRIWTLWIPSLVLLFLIWFLYGSYQVYSVYPPNYTPAAAANLSPTWRVNATSAETNRAHLNATQAAAEPHCDRTVYLFAFWTTTLVYVLAVNALLMIICLFGFMKAVDTFVQLLTT